MNFSTETTIHDFGASGEISGHLYDWHNLFMLSPSIYELILSMPVEFDEN